MKGRIAFVLCALVCASSVPVFAYGDILCFGANYTYATAGGHGSHAVGGHLSVIANWGYLAVGFSADVSGERDLNMDELRGLGVGKVDTNFFSVPIRVGYPFMIGRGSARFLIIPSLAFDMQFFEAKFSQKIDIYDSTYKMNYKCSGWGYTLGASLNLGMQHKLGRAYLRYGCDLDFGLLTVLLMNIDYSGFLNGSTSDSYVGTAATDGLQFAASPYLCIGFRL